jgi:hypothetical protein
MRCASRRIPATLIEEHRMTNFTPTPDWQSVVPRYRVVRDLRPAEKSRFNFEPPFAETWQSDVWQYGDRPLVTGEEIETTAWPHASFRPLNYSAQQVLAFFNGAMKSRMTLSPWFDGRVRLDNGLSGPTFFEVRAPQVRPMNLRPVA